MGRLPRFLSLHRRERQLFLEAAVLLLISHLGVRTISFRHIDNFLRTHWNGNAQKGIDVIEVDKLVDLSLSRVANNLFPWKNLCLSRSIAAFVMLRRRGIPAVVVAGVKSSEASSLHAHAWIDIDHAEHSGSAQNPDFTAVLRIGQKH
jgi:hypothetical protein